MTWVRLDDQFPDHPKVAGLSNDAFCLHVTALCWTSAHRQDGKIHGKMLSRLAWRCQDPANAVLELIDAGVWEENDAGGWIIHDFGDYNPTSAHSDELSAIRSEAGRKGAMARWQKEWQTDDNDDGKSMPPSPSPIDDDDGDDDISSSVNSEPDARQQAIDALGRLGIWNSVDLARFDDMWPELAGRTDWVGRAVTIARDNAKGSPIKYALKVLANAIHTNEPPGERRTGNKRKAERMPDDYESLKAKYGTTEVSELPWAKAALANLEH